MSKPLDKSGNELLKMSSLEINELSTKRVDVIIPNYNRINSLREAVASAHYCDLVAHIYIIDDGSSAETIENYAELERQYKKVKVIFSTRSHDPGLMRKIGVNQAESEWIAFLDSDDKWKSDKLEKQLYFAFKNKFDFVCSNALSEDTSKELISRRDSKSISLAELLHSNNIVTSSVLCRKSLLAEIEDFASGLEVKNVEDYATWLRIALTHRIGFLHSTLVVYSGGDGRFSQESSQDHIARAFLDLEKYVDNLAKRKIYSRFHLRLAKFIKKYFSVFLV